MGAQIGAVQMDEYHVHRRFVGSSEPASSTLLHEALNMTADHARLLSAIGGRLATPRKVKAWGRAGDSMTFWTVFRTMYCEDVTAEFLPHLKERFVAKIRKMFKAVSPPKPVCAAPFGVLVVVTGLSPSGKYSGYTAQSFAQLNANIIAGILDQDSNGRADDPKLMAKMRTGPGGAWVSIIRKGIHNEQLHEWSKLLGNTVDTNEEMDFPRSARISFTTRAMVEETYHTYQHAREKAYPTIFGLQSKPARCQDNPSTCIWPKSIAGKCSAMAQCDWYKHPEMLCKGKSAEGITGGGCASPSCAGIEWSYNVEMVFSDNLDFSAGMPESWWQSPQAIKSKLLHSNGDCRNLLEVLKNRHYHVLSKKLSFDYRASGGPGPAPRPAPAPRPRPAPAPTPRPPSGLQGERKCEGHGFDRHECKRVGCCNFHFGKCWARNAERCDTKMREGEDACEGHGFSEHKCKEVGCCFFEDGECWPHDRDSCHHD